MITRNCGIYGDVLDYQELGLVDRLMDLAIAEAETPSQRPVSASERPYRPTRSFAK